jgi:hypothetical protein
VRFPKPKTVSDALGRLLVDWHPQPRHLAIRRQPHNPVLLAYFAGVEQSSQHRIGEMSGAHEPEVFEQFVVVAWRGLRRVDRSCDDLP